MPKRLIDDSLLSSPSLAKCSPRAQDAFPRFILLADDFGCFEVVPRALVGKGWPKRTDVSEADVLAWLNEYADAGMACLYTALERQLCYLTGWNGPHGQKKRAEYDPNAPAGTPGRHGSKRRLPAPDPELVAAVVAGVRRDVDGKTPGTNREDEKETPSDSVPAREASGSRSVPAAFPAVPGPVVPDVVPVPVPGSPSPARDPDPADTRWPLIAACLVALWDRKRDALWPSGDKAEETADRLERAIASMPLPEAIEILDASLQADPAHPWLGWHLDALKPKPKAKARTRGDLGAELRPWPTRLTDAERRQARAEFAAIHPDFESAPLQATGDPEIHPTEAIEAIREFHERWRAIAEARS